MSPVAHLTAVLFNPVSFFGGINVGNMTDAMSLLKGTGIITLLIGLIYLLIKFELINLVSIEEETIGIRTRWGRPHYKRNRRLDRLEPGRHWKIKGMHGIILRNLRDNPANLGEIILNFQGRTCRTEMTLVWAVAGEDSPKGDQDLYNSIYKIRDTDREDQDVSVLEQMVTRSTLDGLRRMVSGASADQDGFPELSLKKLKRQVGRQLRANYGIRLIDLLIGPMSWKGEQLHKDGLKAIADAIKETGWSFDGNSIPDFPDTAARSLES